MYAGVVELDALTDPVGSAAQDQHRGSAAGGDFSLEVVAAVVVRRTSGEFGRTGVNGLVDRPYSERPADSTYHVLAEVPEAGDLSVRESMPLGCTQHAGAKLGRGFDHGRDLQQQHELIDEPGIDLGSTMNLLRCCAGAERLHDHIESAIVGSGSALQQLLG